MVGAVLFRFARWISKQGFVGQLIGWGFRFGSFLLPVTRLVNTRYVIAFYHPRPSFDDHILIVPKRVIPTFVDLVSDRWIGYLVAILSVAGDIARQQNFDRYSLGVNGGPSQDVLQVHFHLYRDQAYFREFSGVVPEDAEESEGGIRVFSHPNPCRETHLVICCPLEMKFSALLMGPAWSAFAKTFQQLATRYFLIEQGYTVFVQGDRLPEQCGLLFHVVSGKIL